jgi:hydrogenase nickel incorporation protein HypA/HybF
MHELAIAESIIKTVLDEAERRKLGYIKKIAVRVGALTDIVPDALRFGFEAASIDTPLQGTTLEINTIPVAGKCRNCGRGFEVEEHVFVCPDCESFDIEMTRGDELGIEYIEVDDGSD